MRTQIDRLQTTLLVIVLLLLIWTELAVGLLARP